MRLPTAAAASWTAFALGLPLLGATAAAASAIALDRRLPDVPERHREAARLSGLGQVHAASVLASGATRTWWPASLLAALVSTRARRVLVAAIVVPTLFDWWKVRRSIDLGRFAALRILDDAAYGAGVWKGAFEGRSFAALRPRLTDTESVRALFAGWLGRATSPERAPSRR